jgi:phosphatidylglycerol---prolipoprotein diacylglyceryl transferase
MFKLASDGIVIFGLKIYFYALVIISGALLGSWLASKEAKRRGYDPEMIWDVLPWLLIAGIVGARIWHVLTPSASILVNGVNPYFIHPLEMFNIRQGGLGIPGGVIAGVLALFIYARKKRINFASWTDVIAPGLALAQGIGRWGNFFNHELYGLKTNITFFPYAVKINNEFYLATFFYEFVWNLLNMCLLLWLPRKFGDKMKPGDNFLVYMIFYGVGRFLLEFIRLDYSPIAGVNINQTVMAVMIIASSLVLVLRHLKKKEPVADPGEEISQE